MAANTCNQPPSFHDGTGAQADYVIGFPYINRADVEVYVGSADDWTQYTEGNAANANEYQWQNATTIRLNAASGTDNVRITRETDRCAADTTFTAGASIRAEDLNENMTQNLYITQEIVAALGDLGITVPPGSSGDADTSTWNNPSYLKWTGEGFTANGVLEAGDAWQDSDDWIVTAAAGDDRWLTIPGGGGSPITAGDGIRLDAPAEINVDLDTNSGLEFNSGDLRVNPGQGIVVDIGKVLVRGNQRRIGTVQFGTGDIYTFPTADGTANQVLTTNGSGTLRWETPTGGGGGGGAGASVANTTALNAVAVPADRESGDAYMITDSTNVDGATNPGIAPNEAPNPAINGLPAAPDGGWGAAINVIVSWNATDDGWTFVGYRAATPDERYVLETGDTMTGPLVLDDTTLQIQEGTDTLTIDWPTGTANRTISFPDADGTVALTTDITAPGNGTLTITAGNNLTGTVTGGAFTANKGTNTTITLDVDDVFVLTAGDTMTGNLQMDGASVIADNGETVPDNDGNWDIQDSNVWQVPDGRTIDFPDDSAAPIPGQTGIFVCAGTVAAWDNVNGGTWEHPGGTQQAGDANGAIIPFYVQTATRIILGVQTVGS